MSFRHRIVLAAGAAVAIAILLASAAVYVLVRDELRSQVDSQLEDFAGGVFAVRIETAPSSLAGGKSDLKQVIVGSTDKQDIRKFMLEQGPQSKTKGVEVGLPSDPLGGRLGFAQIITAKGKVLGPGVDGVHLPVTAQARAVARGEAGAYFSDAEIKGVHSRVYTRPAGHGRAVQAARSLSEVDDTLSRLTLILIAVCAGGIGLAIGLGLLVGRTAMRPVARLTAAAEHVARTRDLSRRIQTGSRRDELASLARSFNTMLGALERSLAAQRQLVADASHELRTPLTSLRTNVEVLAEGERLAADERERLLADVVAQLEELTALVGDLVDLARDEQQPPAPEDVRFDLLVAGAVARSCRHWPELSFDDRLEPVLVHADPARLDRAVTNLLANAAQWSPAGGAVEVELSDGELRVRDHGPGFDPDEVEHVFDRFYRSPAARGRPGSGLGLAIVRQVAESHGGSVTAANAPGGGAQVLLRLPALAGASPAPPAGVALVASKRVSAFSHSPPAQLGPMDPSRKGAEMKMKGWAVALALALCAATLGACGGGGSDDGSESSSASAEDAQIAFTECMREHGVEMDDPKPGQAGAVIVGKPGDGGGGGPDDPMTKQALAACETKLPKGGGQEKTPEEEASFKEGMLAFAQCMRENGIDMPDPQFGADGKVQMTMQAGKGDSSNNPESPAFKAAQEACQDVMPEGVPTP